MILITGASSGLGAALASLYAKENEPLTLTGRNAERLQTVANALTPFSNKPIAAITADLAAASGGTFHLLDLTPTPDRADPDLEAFRGTHEMVDRHPASPGGDLEVVRLVRR